MLWGFSLVVRRGLTDRHSGELNSIRQHLIYYEIATRKTPRLNLIDPRFLVLITTLSLSPARLDGLEKSP